MSDAQGEIGQVVHPHTYIATAGVPITCPGCKVEIGKFRENVMPGFRIGVESIQFHPDQQRHAGEEAVCKACKSSYFKNDWGLDGYRFKVHTPLGWL